MNVTFENCSLYISYSDQENSEDSNQNIDCGGLYDLKIMYQRSKIKSFVREVQTCTGLLPSLGVDKEMPHSVSSWGELESMQGVGMKSNEPFFLSAVTQHPNI